ncbi:MAG: hypothetical protein AAGJ38_05535, partial [Planctomycetota bacterium]
EFGYINDQLTPLKARVGVARNHAKLMLVRLTDGRHIVAHGSLNLRRCNSFEQIAISQDPDLYDFFAKYINDAMAGRVSA